MKKILQSDVFVAGLAMFSMFFGAGNIVFPLMLGTVAGNKTIIALMGFLITAVGLPILGVIGNVLFEADYKAFFYRMGKIPGFFFITVIMCFIGPFGAIPRCLTLSHSALKMYFPNVSLFSFSIGSVIAVYIFASRKSKIMDIMGYLLTPIKLTLFSIIIIKGLLFPSAIRQITTAGSSLFAHGIQEGYKTLDLAGGIFFSGIILHTLRRKYPQAPLKQIAFTSFKGGILGACLLGLIYAGLSAVAAFQGAPLTIVPGDELLTVIAYNVLGPVLGIVSSFAVSFACLATAIALTTIFTDFLQNEIFFRRINYVQTLLISLLITFTFSNLGFAGIMKVLEPIVMIGYPAIIVLTIANILHKLFAIETVKIPVYVTLLVSLISYFK